MMTREELMAFAAEYDPALKTGVNKQYPEVITSADKIEELARHFKNEPATLMDYLFCLTAADRKDGLNIVYHLTSTSFNHCIMLKVILTDKSNPSLPSVSHIWKAAEFYEREVFDLFGVSFQNHPDMRRIFLDDDWKGFPLRKDYKDSFILEH
jgi:NADH-quinone oxidoreductase subunit C